MRPFVKILWPLVVSIITSHNLALLDGGSAVHPSALNLRPWPNKRDKLIDGLLHINYYYYYYYYYYHHHHHHHHYHHLTFLYTVEVISDRRCMPALSHQYSQWVHRTPRSSVTRNSRQAYIMPCHGYGLFSWTDVMSSLWCRNNSVSSLPRYVGDSNTTGTCACMFQILTRRVR